MRRAATISFIDLLGQIDVSALVRRQAATGKLESYVIYELAANLQAVDTDGNFDSGAHCGAALDQMLQSDAWMARRGGISRLVELGVGSGGKTMTLALNFKTRRADRQDAVLVDFNRDLLATLSFALATQGKLSVRAVRATFDQYLDLNLASSRISSFTTGTVVSMLGKTFGNLPEETTLSRLAKAMRHDDLFLCGLELCSFGQRHQDMETVLNDYRKSTAVKKVFSAPLKHLPGAGPLRIGLARGDSAYSVLKKTATIFAQTEYRGKPLPIVHSNRYDEDELIALFSRHGLRYVTATTAPANTFYRCYLFAR